MEKPLLNSNDMHTNLQERIAELEKENALLRNRYVLQANDSTVLVPDEMKPLFDLAQQTVSKYFEDIKMKPNKGTIEINDQRYVLIRASALSKDFLDTIQNLYSDRGDAEAMAIGKNFLFDIAHALGMNDAKNFHAKMNLTDPIAKLSAGPVHFAFTGWAFVEILPESKPSPDDNFYLIYNHPYSFEADSWLRSGKQSDMPVCIMNTGYSSGWCEESFGIPLTAVEVSCRGKGDDNCTFIMAPPHKIQQHLDRFHLHEDSKIGKQDRYDIPTFFERKKVEEELKRSKALAEESARAKEDFVANMSHELRTPLGAILGFTALLKKTVLDNQQKDYLDAISNAGSGLLAIINDILDLSKLDAGKFIIENIPFNAAGLLHAVQTMFAPKAKEKKLQFTVAVDAALNFSINGDPMRLTQILVNLIGNAIKFTEQGFIDVRCVIEHETEDEVSISFTIKDSGIGIPQEKMDTIFDRFMQADANITRSYGGTGLGLAITKQLIDLLGGNIQARSKQGIGTEFYFTLPFAKGGTQMVQHEKQVPVLPLYPSTKTILVVEDNPMNQKLTTIILKNNGFDFILAQNGSEAIAILKEKTPDLILMDLQMPVMDGYQTTCMIRDELHLKTPIIAMTAHALAGEKEKCKALGINDYLSKPFSEEDLLVKIGDWVHVAQKEQLIDLSYLKKQTRNNKESIKEMIDFFVQENPKDILALREAIEGGDYLSMYKKVHALRNSIGFFGLTVHMGDALLQMEKMAHAKKGLDEIKTKFEVVSNCCAMAVDELHNTII